MIDVFVRVWADSELRAHLAAAVIHRLTSQYEYGSRVRIIECLDCIRLADDVPAYSSHYLPADDFHRASKALAADLADGEYLIVIDDDQLPLYRGWATLGEQIIKGLPGFAAVSGWSVTHEVPKPKAPAGTPQRGYVEISDSIGCPMVVRRSALRYATEAPIEDKARADTIITQRLQREGLTGITADWRYVHAGIGLSQVIPQHWMPECPA